MPSLQGVVAFFAETFTKATGEQVFGCLREPQAVRSSFDGLFTPRFMLDAAIGQNINAGDVLLDNRGTYFLCGTWAPSAFINTPIANVFVLYACNVDIPWARTTTTIEPISGLRRAGASTLLQMVRGLKEPVSRVSDGENVEISKYRVLVGVPVLLGDTLDGARVQRVETMNGLSYCETL